MGRLLVHIVTGPENPTRVALGLLVARTALGEGHTVDVFFAGDGVSTLRPETLDAGQGIGTGASESTSTHWSRVARRSTRRPCPARHAASAPTARRPGR